MHPGRRSIALTLIAVSLAAPSTAGAADTTAPRVSSVQLSGSPTAPHVDMCLSSSSSNPARESSPFIRMRLSEPATVTLSVLPVLGKGGGFALPTGLGSPTTRIALPAGPNLLQSLGQPHEPYPGATQLPASLTGLGYIGVIATAQDAAGNRSAPALSNVIPFGSSGGMGARPTWPCDTPSSPSARLRRQLEIALTRLFG